jgi:hypothetical protein
LQNEPDLVEMMRVPANNPIEIWGGPSDPDSIHIEENTESDNPEALTPQIRSSGEVSAHRETMQTSGRTSTPNRLFDVITIYDNEESS